MPVARINVIAGHARSDLKAVVAAAADAMGRVLEAPLERLQVWLNEVDADFWAIAGEPASLARGHRPANETVAAFVEVLVLKGRPLSQHRALVAELTGVVAEGLAIDRSRVRVVVQEVAPESWGIGGVPASEVRAAEIRARAQGEGA